MFPEGVRAMQVVSKQMLVGATLVLGLAVGCGSSGTDPGGTGGDADATTTGGGATEGDVTGSGDTTGGGDTTGVGTTDGGCEAFCQPTWTCGPDGCGGICGEGCGAGFVCNNAKHTCEPEPEKPEPGAVFGAQCGPNADCQAQIAGPNGNQQNPQWPACLNAQCESGVCMNPSCSKACTIGKDEVDHTGSAGPDGIDDADVAFNDCAGAEDGILGTAWVCTEFADVASGQQSTQRCVPGTTLAPCAKNADCPAAETCQLQFTLGTYQSRCGTAPKGAVPMGTACNENPVDGELAFCETGLCFGVGCTGFCTEDGDCGNESFECKKEFQLFGSDTPEITFPLCLGKVCKTNAGCTGDNNFCAISGNGKQGPDLDWEHICAVAPADAANLGEECEDDATDNIPKPECKGPCLNNGTCSALCDADSDCAAVESMLCNLNEVPVDTSVPADEIDDKVLRLGLCVDYPGSQAACQKDADCSNGEACSFRSFVNGDGAWDGAGICTTPEAGDANVGEPCGGNTGIGCKSGFCLSQNGDQPGYCTTLCASADDCPKNTSLGQFQGTYNMFCRSLLFGTGPSIDVFDDNIYLPVCLPVLAEDTETGTKLSSLSDCNDDNNSCGENEACFGFAIASGAFGATSLDMRCISTLDQTLQPATGNLGDACDITFEAENGVACKSNYCLPDAGTDKGYCGALCETNADCTGPGMVCDANLQLDRINDEQDLTLNLCQKVISCIPCTTNGDCAGGNVCANQGGLGALENRVCVPGCEYEGDADCSGTDGGSKCVDSLNGKGAMDGVKGCIPDTCPN